MVIEKVTYIKTSFWVKVSCRFENKATDSFKVAHFVFSMPRAALYLDMKGKPSLTSDNILDLVDIMRSRLGNKLIFVGMEYCVFYANILDMK